jgi:hypothetical protein
MTAFVGVVSFSQWILASVSAHRHCRGMGAEHQISSNRRCQNSNEDSRDADNDKGEDNVDAVELQSLYEIVDARPSVPDGERGDQRQGERVDKERQHHRQCRRNEKQQGGTTIVHAMGERNRGFIERADQPGGVILASRP